MLSMFQMGPTLGRRHHRPKPLKISSFTGPNVQILTYQNVSKQLGLGEYRNFVTFQINGVPMTGGAECPNISIPFSHPYAPGNPLAIRLDVADDGTVSFADHEDDVRPGAEEHWTVDGYTPTLDQLTLKGTFSYRINENGHECTTGVVSYTANRASLY
jgi:hypothetical protein